jgi:hypothetical protein
MDRKRSPALAALAFAVVGLLGTVQVAPAEAGSASASVLVAAEVRPRAAVSVDQRVVTLRPGERVTVTVTVMARLAAASVVAVALDTAVPGSMTYRFLDAGGPLTSGATLGAVRRSGVHTLPLTLALARGAVGPVTLPLAFRTVIGGTSLVAAVTQGLP